MNKGDRPLSQACIQRAQRLGRLLSGMIMPNIGAFLTWGLLTALFIPSGWLPNATLAGLLHPMMFYLLPLLIGFTGGNLVYGHRGGVVGAVVTMGAIASTTSPMIFGAMITGPTAGWIIKKVDARISERVPAGFEMLANNFASGIFGGLLAIAAFVAIGPLIEYGGDRAAALVAFAIQAGLAPLASLVIEPAKVLFLNNVVNHGVLSPLGFQQAAQTGASLLFLMETNPGPGLGVLLAYFYFAKGTARQSAPGAMLIHFFGGIHEVYFPYVLMQPRLFVAVIAGGAAGVFTFSWFSAGLVSVPSPGSILSLIAMAPKGGLLPVLAGVLVSTLTSFVLSWLLLDRRAFGGSEAMAQAQEKLAQLKGAPTLISQDCIPEALDTNAELSLVAVACDAGMGSSAMGATKLKAALSERGARLKVISCPIDQLNDAVDLVITHQKLTPRAVQKLPGAVHIAVADFINSPVYQELAQRVADEQAHRSPISPATPATHSSAASAGADQPVLQKTSIKLGLESVPQEAAIRLAGEVLVSAGYVQPEYIPAMLERETQCSTYIGNGAAIPHGTSEAKEKINATGISILQFPQGVDFDGNTAYLVIGIAALGDSHLKILAALAQVMSDNTAMEQLKSSTDLDAIFKKFNDQTEATKSENSGVD